MRPTPRERFDAKWVADENGCHIWTGAPTTQRYGQFQEGGRLRRAHIVAWEWANGGPRPVGTEIAHTCEVTKCVNPDHLVAQTHQENVAWRFRNKSTCEYGHPPERYVHTTTQRYCLDCKLTQNKARRSANRAEYNRKRRLTRSATHYSAHHVAETGDQS